MATAAFPQPGLIQEEIKMGALASFAAAFVSYIGARLIGVRRRNHRDEQAEEERPVPTVSREVA
jgi:hypothetical protein